jgi:archaellum component FlaC
MSESCAIESCESTLGISCHCCDKIFCPDHLDEHYESINAQLNPLVDEINTLNDQVMRKTKEKLIGNCLEKLDRWRDESYKMINSLYEKKHQKLEEYYAQKTEKQRKEIDEMQLKLNELLHQQDATQQDIQFFKSTIENIKHEIKEIHQISYEINIRPLEFYENFISIEEIKSDEIDFTTLLTPYKIIDCLDEFNVACASNEKFLLIHQGSELHLLDKELTLIKKLPWKNCWIYDMCWSSTLKKFIVTTHNRGIYLINENLTLTEEVEINPHKIWWRCTCSDTSLYLLSSQNNSEIFEFDLLPSFQLIKRWKIPHLSKEHDKILDITSNNQTLALLIKNQNKLYMELRSSITFDRLWSVQLDIKRDILHSTVYFCLLNSNDWLVMDHNNSCLIHINKYGIIRSTIVYNPSPITALLFGSNILAIQTEKYWNFHQI